MDFKQLFALSAVALSCSAASAGNMTIPDFRPIVSVQGGYSSNTAGDGSSSFADALGNTFTYHNSNHSTNTGFGGAFLGAEFPLPEVAHYYPMLQLGAEYNYFGDATVEGNNTAGLEPALATAYQYQYNVRTQQVLGIIKLLTTVCNQYHVYGEVGLGAAFNHADSYSASTSETGNINLTPSFKSGNTSEFSYSLGLGAEMDVTKNVRVGIGYRYSDFGHSSLGSGQVAFGNYRYPVPSVLSNSNTYANQLLFRISYLA